ncbi:MAG TPA: hypothetical protein P5026_09905 [Kiritimatiellia bacterium]|nr:hypothetical protein [Kiritimatiellia bacterium]HRU70697.1 hypothetical protein [Kiritimatiellia bacterium]
MIRWLLLAGGVIGCVARCSFAAPALEYVYPAGAAQGSECEVEIGGTPLTDVTQAVVSGEGVKLTYLGPVKTVTLNKKGRPIPVVVPNRLRFRMVVDKNAVPGLRALRASTAYRLTEPVGFEIQAGVTEWSGPVTNRAEACDEVLPSFPVCVNGRVVHEKPNRYRFEARQGMKIVAVTQPDVLPPTGFLPSLTFCDATGRPCDSVTVYAADRAPAAVFDVPRDGTYSLDVGSAVPARWGDDCVYRLRVGELPLITGFTPSRAAEGESLNVRLEGVNLPQKRVRLFTGGKNSALCLQAITEGACAVPGLRFALDAESAAPDFRVTMTPASLNIPAEGSALVKLRVQRINGFAGEIRVALDFPPLSIASEGGVIPADATESVLTVSTDGVRYPRVVFSLALTATAEINGQTVKRAVLPVRRYAVADVECEQVFAEPAARSNPGMNPLRINVAPNTPLIVPSAEASRLTLFSSSLATHLGGLYKPVVIYPPRGFTVAGVQRTNKQERAAVLLKCDPQVWQPGATGHLVLGCVKRDDTQREPIAVTQCVPFVVR